MTLENCPKCEKKLPPPFPSSGRQVGILLKERLPNDAIALTITTIDPH